jgi:hypothetical protein
MAVPLAGAAAPIAAIPVSRKGWPAVGAALAGL